MEDGEADGGGWGRWKWRSGKMMVEDGEDGSGGWGR